MPLPTLAGTAIWLFYRFVRTFFDMEDPVELYSL